MKPATLQFATAAIAAGGVVSVIAFSHCFLGDTDRLWSRIVAERVFGPYFIVALAACFSRTRTLAIISFFASLTVLAFGCLTYLSLISSGRDSINDICLLTLPLQRLFSVAALAVAVIGLIITRITNAPNVA